MSSGERTAVHNAAVDKTRADNQKAAVRTAGGAAAWDQLTPEKRDEALQAQAAKTGTIEHGYNDVTRDTGMSLADGEKLENAGFKSSKDVAEASPDKIKDALTGGNGSYTSAQASADARDTWNSSAAAKNAGQDKFNDLKPDEQRSLIEDQYKQGQTSDPGYTMKQAASDARGQWNKGGAEHWGDLSKGDQAAAAQMQFQDKTGYGSEAALDSTASGAQQQAQMAEAGKKNPPKQEKSAEESKAEKMGRQGRWQSTMDNIIGASYHRRRQQVSSWDDIEAMMSDGDKASDHGRRNA
jgi:hypothetical protein